MTMELIKITECHIVIHHILTLV